MVVYFIYQDQVKSENEFCVIGEDCEYVQQSTYGELFEIKIIYYSLVAFVGLLILFFINEKIYLLASIVGVVFSIYLIGVQLFVLKQICINCMIVDVSMIIILILSLFLFYNKNNKK